ncbi:helix-turn-helix domain-containing protein [Saccharopolyspora spinosporotrichia]
MPRPERPLDADNGPVAEFAAELRLLREKAGSPPYRELARRAHYSVTTLSEAAGGKRLPTLAVTLAYVSACGGNRDDWEQRWQEATAQLAARKPPPDPPTVASPTSSARMSGWPRSAPRTQTGSSAGKA